MRFIIDFLYLLAVVTISPVILYRMARHNRYRAGWPQKFGKITRKQPDKKCIWIHAVSVGEVNAAKTLVTELKTRFPDFEIVISATTDTGFACADALYSPNHAVFYFPYDFSWIIQRAFRKIDPTVCLLMELEVWPNFVATAKDSHIPIVIVNGRISDKSFSIYKKTRPLVKKVFENLTAVLAQTQQYARRFKQIGVPEEKIIVTGSLKYDTAQIVEKLENADILAKQLNIGSDRLIVAGGTGNDEEQFILDVYQKLIQQERFRDLRLAIVPRKPERFDGVAQLIQQAGFTLVRYSQLKGKTAQAEIEKQAVILGDTMGDLRKFYSLATIIFVGRSLVPMGGSDMMEAAALGKCTIFGPYAFNFQQTVEALLSGGGAIMVKDESELLATCRKCLAEPAFAAQIAKNGREIIRKNQGATIKTIQQIAKFLESAQSE
ncbi:MAG: 3-deoxy-D-manno-octulosonic acid transferase [Planctomycetota bacterium]